MQRYFNTDPKLSERPSSDNPDWLSASLLDQQTAKSIAKDLLENRLGKSANPDNVNLLAEHLMAFDQTVGSSNRTTE